MTVKCYNYAMENKKYLIEDLCELTGFSRRTIRYYVQLGLIDPPAGRGRGGYYADSHLEKLMKIKTFQERGLRLDAITVLLQTGGAVTEDYSRDRNKEIADLVLEREVWVHFPLAPGIEIRVSREVEQQKRHRIMELVRTARSVLNKGV